MSITVIDPAELMQIINTTRLLNQKLVLKTTGLTQKLLKDNLEDILTNTINSPEERQKANEIIKNKIYTATYGDECEIFEKFYPIDYKDYYKEPFLMREDIEWIAVQAIQFPDKTFIKTFIVK